MKTSSAILISKKCDSHQRFLASKCGCGLPKLRSSCHPQQCLLRRWRNARNKVNKETGLAPDSCGANERNKFSETRGLRLPVHRMLNSLTWYPIFDVQTPCPLVANLQPSFYSLTRSPASLEQFPQSYGDAVSWAQSPKHSHQIKNSLLSGCDYIFFSQQFKASWYCLDHHIGILVWLFSPESTDFMRRQSGFSNWILRAVRSILVLGGVTLSVPPLSYRKCHLQIHIPRSQLLLLIF